MKQQRKFCYSGKHVQYSRVEALNAAEEWFQCLLAMNPGTSLEIVDSGKWFLVKKATNSVHEEEDTDATNE